MPKFSSCAALDEYLWGSHGRELALAMQSSMAKSINIISLASVSANDNKSV
jgi:hypothetical protein